MKNIEKKLTMDGWVFRHIKSQSSIEYLRGVRYGLSVRKYLKYPGICTRSTYKRIRELHADRKEMLN